MRKINAWNGGLNVKITTLRSRIVTVIALPTLTLALLVGFGTQGAGASSSAVCGNSGSGYCLNDWGGHGASGDAVKMYYGGVANDDFYVQDVNRCGGRDTVTATSFGDASNCPFGDVSLDNDFRGQHVVQIVDTNSETECVGSTRSDTAVLARCANPLSGSGGGQGVIMVQSLGGTPPNPFVSRFVSDQHSTARFLTSGGNPGVQANYNSETIWGGYLVFAP
jgi:hypothetical protein